MWSPPTYQVPLLLSIVVRERCSGCVGGCDHVAVHVQGFRKHSDLLSASVDWILLHQGNSGLPIPFTTQEQLRILSVGANYRPGAVAEFFAQVLARGTQRSPWVLQVLGTIATMLRPTPAIAQALCAVLQTFTGTPADLARDVTWQRYMLAASALLGGVSTHLHQDMDPASLPADLPTATHAIDRSDVAL